MIPVFILLHRPAMVSNTLDTESVNKYSIHNAYKNIMIRIGINPCLLFDINNYSLSATTVSV